MSTEKHKNSLEKIKSNSKKKNETITAQSALCALRKQERLKNQFNSLAKNNPSQIKKIYEEIDDNYSRLSYSKQIKVGTTVKVSIMPHHEEYYMINCQNLLFPIRIKMRNVKNTGMLYISFNKSFPGLGKKNYQTKNKIMSIRKEIQKGNKQRQYDYKKFIQQDMMVTLLKPVKKNVFIIYANFIANADYFTFQMKFDHQGFPDFKEAYEQAYTMSQSKFQDNQTSKIRLYTELSSQIKRRRYQQSFYFAPTHKLPRFHEKIDNNFAQKISTINNHKTTQNLASSEIFPFKQHLSTESSCVKINQCQKEYFLKNMNKIQSLEKIKKNRQRIEKFNQKQKLLKQRCLCFKTEIEDYKMHYNQCLSENRKDNTIICPLLFVIIFIHKSRKLFIKKQQEINAKFRKNILVQKFVKQIKLSYSQTSSLVASARQRNLFTSMSIIQLQGQILENQSKRKSQKIIFKCFEELNISFRVSIAFNCAKQYQQSMILIQRRWKTKYIARQSMIKSYAQKQVMRLLRQKKYLQSVYSQFCETKIFNKIYKEYMIEENLRFRDIYHAFRKQCQEIKEYEQENNKIAEYNKGLVKSKKPRQYLQIPHKPHTPQFRYFRNLVSLKSMLRTWLEIQYRKKQIKQKYF